MGDMTKFNSAIEYYTFNVLLICLLISEIFIFFYTRSKQNMLSSMYFNRSLIFLQNNRKHFKFKYP